MTEPSNNPSDKPEAGAANPGSRGALIERPNQLPSTSLHQHELYGVPEARANRLREYWDIILRRRWTVLTCFAIVLVAVMTATFLMTKIYRATLTLQIDQQESKAMVLGTAATQSDSGYFDMDDILQAQRTGCEVFVSQPCAKKKPAATAEPVQDYSKAAFVYEPETDTYRCPAGQPLSFVQATHREHGKPCEARIYRCQHCRDCPAYASKACTRSARGRSIKRYAHDAHLPAYQEQLRSPRGRQLRHKRLHVVEPVFAATKERLGMVRFLLRGLLNAKAEWHLTCAVHNLVQLWRHWWRDKRQLAAA